MTDPSSSIVGSRHLYRQAFHHAPVGMMTVGLDARILDVNRRFCDLVGLDRERLLRLGLRAIPRPKFFEEALTGAQALLAGERDTFGLCKRVVLKSGAMKWLEAEVSLVRGEDDAPECLLVVVQDATERLEALNQLQESEARYRAIARSLPGGAVVLFDRDLRYLLAEGAGLAEVGLSREMLEGRTIHEVFDPDTAAAIEPQYQAALEGREVVLDVPYEGRMYQTRGTAVRSPSGEIIAGLVVTTDVTDRIRAEELRSQARHLEALARLTGGMTHEFNNRFAALIPAMEMTREDAENAPHLARELDFLLDELRRAARTVNRLMGFSEFTALGRQEITLDEALAGILDTVEATLPSGWRLERRLEAQGATVGLDRPRLASIVEAIVQNALEAGGESGELLVRTRALEGEEGSGDGVGGREVELCISDQGPGMPPEVAERAMEPFFTTRDPTVHQGLGLAMTHGLVRGAGGRMEITGEEGCTVRIVL